MAVTITTAANYWIAPNALTITLNALGEANRIQASVASGAMIMVYMRGIKPADPTDPDTAKNGDGLEFDNGHNYRRWPLSISPTYFNSNDEKYVYVAIPRKASVGTDAVVVFPSQKLDIYGYSIKEVPKRNARGQMIDEDGYPTDDITKAVKEEEQDEQLGTDDYFYVWLQGIITETNGTSLRDWDAHCESGYLDSDEAISSLETEWYKWDPISGTVTFLKEIFMDAGSIFSNLKAKVAEIADLNVTNLLDAIKAKIDDIRSHNFEEGLTDGNGFRLTADNGDGASELEVDFLKVRKKATFMELEIRKETFVGGNQNYSPAGSVIYRVEYLDVNNEPLGYKTKKVPWLLKGFAFLGGPFAGAYHLATKRRVYVGMTDEEWPKCHHFRCYLISDDGTTATRNWWRYGDQAKCQSFNKAASVQSKHDNTYNSGTSVVPDPATPMAEKTYASQPVETSYWWRMVTNTGSKLLEDGYVYDFVDFPYEGWQGYNSMSPDEAKMVRDSFRDPGSGMPVAGDTLVCIGNRYEKDRMNLINLSTTGDDNDPPSICGYRGVHGFKLQKSNRVFQISPKETMFRSKNFYLLNDDDDPFRVPLERGEWELGQRYHYYDRVSWDGSIWLCMVLDEYVWQDADGNTYADGSVTDIKHGEGSFTYYAYDRQIPDLDIDDRIDGDLVYTGTDHYYATGKVGTIVVYQIMKYTYLEPSDEHNGVWLCEVSKGTEITRSEIHYAASLDGINHPDDDSDDWKDTIEATGVLAGQYLWTRTTTYYRDKNDPDREPTRTYSVARWGIDGDGISEINSYYTCTQEEISDMAAYEKTHTVPWYETFEMAVAATQHSIGELQGWYIWEKTQIIYDMAPAPDGSARPKPDLINYRVSRIGQDGQIGQEEYYCLREFDTYEEAFPPSFAWVAPYDVGIQWYNQRNPAADDWRLFNSNSWVDKICTEQTKQYDPWKQTTQHPNCPVWSPTMPAYDDSTPAKAKKKYLWNFEQRIDGQGTEYATKPICIGDHSRGIVGVLELYALSAGSGPQTTGRHIPDDVWKANGNSETDYQHPSQDPKDTLKTWSDEVYDRAPTEALPYQWNWTRTLYNQPKYPGGKIPASLGGGDEPTDPKTGKWYEDHYHVSAVRGTKGEDGAGVEYIYCRTADANPPQGYLNRAGNVTGYGHIEADETVTIGGKTYPRCRYDDDFVPDPTTVSGVTYTWTDNPRGITQELPYEWVCERKSQSYMLDGQFSGGHIWSEFSAPKEWSKWGYNGQDGDGTEYVFIRTQTDVAPAFSTNDVISGYTSDYKSDEWRPYINNKDACGAESNRTTDDPRGTTRDWPYEWVAKRNKAAAASKTAGETQGQRQWKSYYECTADNSHKMSKWSTYSTLRLDIDNEMDSVMTTAELVITAARTVETVVRLYDGNTEVDLSSAAIGSGGIGLTGEPASSIATRNDPTASGKGRKLSWTFKKDATMSARYVIGISYTYNGQTYQATFTIVASAGTDIYQLRPTYDKIGFRRTSTNLLDPSSVTLGMNVEKITNKGATKMTVAESGQTVRYSPQTMPDKKTDGSAWPTNGVAVAADGNVTNVFVAMFDTAGNLLDRETVPVVRDGKNGKSGDIPAALYIWKAGTVTSVSAPTVTAASYMAGTSLGGWSKTAPNRDKEGWHLWMSQNTIKIADDGTYSLANSSWSTPVRISGDTGTPGEDGDEREWIYSYSNTGYNGSTGQVHPNGEASGSDTNKNQADWVPNGWTDNPRGVSNSNKTEYASWRDITNNGTTKTYGAFNTPLVWSHYGERGIDGDGCEYVFIRTNSATAPTITDSSDTYGGKTYKDDEYLPLSSAGRCTDDPVGTDAKHRYEWVAKRNKNDADSDGKRTWNKYSGTMALWANWSEDGDDAVVYTIDCADVVKPSDTALPVNIIRALGESVSRLNLTGASSAWSVSLSASVNDSASATVDYPNSRVTLSNFIASTEMTLTLKKSGSVIATKTVRCVADGGIGETGHVGRWYYYAGVYDGTPTHYKMEKTRSPFVKESASVDNYWMLDFGGVEPASHEKTASVAPTSSGQTEWTSMLATFKYIITEAVFANFAKLGTFFINKDWMLSKFGRVYFSDGQSTDISSDSSYNSFVNTYGVEPYTIFEPSWPTSSRPGVMNFCPNYAVDGRSGKTYQNDAYVKGQIVATSGDITGTMRVSGVLNVGTYASGYKSIRLNPSDTNGAGISGYNGTTRVFRLGFNNNGKGYLSMNAGYFSGDIAWTVGDYGSAVLVASNSDTAGSYVDLSKTVSGSGKSARIEMNASGKFVISSDNWPTSKSDVPVGGIYLNGGVLQVRTY